MKFILASICMIFAFRVAAQKEIEKELLKELYEFRFPLPINWDVFSCNSGRSGKESVEIIFKMPREMKIDSITTADSLGNIFAYAYTRVLYKYPIVDRVTISVEKNGVIVKGKAHYYIIGKEFFSCNEIGYYRFILKDVNNNTFAPSAL
jgi:hypothetical protein